MAQNLAETRQEFGLIRIDQTTPGMPPILPEKFLSFPLPPPLVSPNAISYNCAFTPKA
jgi:hypothetical protein